MNTAELISRLLDDLAAHGPREVRAVIGRSGTMPVVDVEGGPERVYLLTLTQEREDRWKAEALAVLNEWEQVWEALGRPGQLGESKAAAVLQHVRTTHATKPPNIDEVNP